MTSKAPKKGAEAAAPHRDLEVMNHYGIHARPAALLVKTASSFRSDVTIEKDGETVSAKSIMALLTLFSPKGTRLRIRAVGPDAGAALDAMQELFDAKFYED